MILRRILIWLLPLVFLSMNVRALVGQAAAFVPTPGRRNQAYARTMTTTRSLVLKSSNDNSSNNESGGGGGGLVSSADTGRSQLFSAFTALELPDQYDAVLTGLCAKLLDETTEAQMGDALQDPLNLLQEMNDKRLPASPRSLMALIDATVKAQNALLTARTLSACLRNGRLTRYGSQQSDVQALPATPTTRVQTVDGTKTRQARLDALPAIPTDERGKEVTAALAFGGILLTCWSTSWLGLDDFTLPANVVATFLLALVAVDNFYDLIQGTSNLVASQVVKNKDNNFELPAKDNLPGNLGTGQVTGTLVRGWSRLVTMDPQRDAQCEAAGLVAAYLMGLPVFSFRPNALEAAQLVVDSTETDVPLDSASGIMRMLVWLYAPVAMEASKYPVLIVSDPQQASGFLDRLEKLQDEHAGLLQDSLFWLEDAQEREDLLKWAFAEADLMLRQNRDLVQTVSERLEGGSATIADCVAAMEEW